MVKINIFLPVATMVTIGSTLAHNLRLRPKDKNEVMLAETDAKKLQYKVPYTRGYPGSPNPFFYDQGEDSDNPDTDWTFIWFWILFVMVASIIAIIIMASSTLPESTGGPTILEKHIANVCETCTNYITEI